MQHSATIASTSGFRDQKYDKNCIIKAPSAVLPGSTPSSTS